MSAHEEMKKLWQINLRYGDTGVSPVRRRLASKSPAPPELFQHNERSMMQ